MHKYLTPPVVLVVPALVHLVPATFAAWAGTEKPDNSPDNNSAVRITLEDALSFMSQK
jgi:uncharacterized membrane protein YjjB (DUF3815 family)